MHLTSLSRGSLAAARILIDRVNPDSFALAEFCARLGARVQIADAGPLAPRYQSRTDELARLGVAVVSDCNLNAASVDYDILVVDSYTSPHEPFVVQARQARKTVTTLADIVFQLSPANTLAVTGSVGKSTTTTLAASMLDLAGLSVCTPSSDSYMKEFVDNPYPNFELVDHLDHLKRSDWIVAELTSSHLEYMHVSPRVAVITSLSPDHVEWHGSLAEYYAAKAVILKHQSTDEWSIINADDDASMALYEEHGNGQLERFSSSRELSAGVFIRDATIVAVYDGREVECLPISDIRIPLPYVTNVLAASAAALAAGVTPDVIGAATRNYKGLRARLQFVGSVEGLAIYNDGLAMTPRKSSRGLETFRDGALVVIAGGERRIEGYGSEGFLHSSPEEQEGLSDVCRLIARKARHIVLVGDAGKEIADQLKHIDHDTSVMFTSSLQEAARASLAVADERCAAILLSPVFYMDLAEVWNFDAIILEEAAALHKT